MKVNLHWAFLINIEVFHKYILPEIASVSILLLYLASRFTTAETYLNPA